MRKNAMKRLYAFFIASALVMGAQAQSSKTTYVIDPVTNTATPTFEVPAEPAFYTPHIVSTAKKSAAARATEYAGGFTLEENQYIVGNFTDDEYWNFGSVPYEGETLVGAVIYSTTYEKLKNARALGIRFCLPEDYDDGTGNIQKVDEVEVVRVTLHDHTIDGVIREATPRSVEKGWNYVKFKTPQELDPEGMFMSYTYMQTKSPTCYGICNWPDPAPGGFYTYLYNSSAGKWMWSDFCSYGYGAVCIQLIVEADPLPDYDLVPTAINNQPSAVGLESEAAVYFTSNSKKDIENFEYTIAVGEKSVTRTTTLPTPIKAGVDQQAGYYMTIPAMDEYGKYDASLTVNKVNGETLAEPTTLKFKQDVYTRLVQRHTVVEEWTGTGCGNCPRGWAGMEYMKEHYPDTFIGIAVHQYNQNDPMYCARYGGLGLSAAPACKIDRKTQADPYYGVDNTGIHNAVAYYSSIAPAVDVTVRGEFGDTQNKVNCTADVEWLTDTGKYTVAYVLTADGLTGKGAWLQQNYYASNDGAAGATLYDIPEFAEFFAGGSKGKAAVELVYNDVMVGSSWSTSGSNLAKALGTTKHTAGEKLTNTYTCSVSVGDACKAAMDYDNLYVTAIILDANNEIVNAARAKVVVADNEGIDSIIAPATPAETYDLSGRRVNASGKGLYIVGGKKVIK